jgi:hypothetical protein
VQRGRRGGSARRGVCVALCHVWSGCVAWSRSGPGRSGPGPDRSGPGPERSGCPWAGAGGRRVAGVCRVRTGRLGRVRDRATSRGPGGSVGCGTGRLRLVRQVLLSCLEGWPVGFRVPCQAPLPLSFTVPSGKAAHGRLPERPKGAVCKTVGLAYVGSNPTPATTSQNDPWSAHMQPGVDLVVVRLCPARSGLLRVVAENTRRSSGI